MSDQIGLRDVWAMTDKPTIDSMTKKVGPSLSATMYDSSSEESSDLESVDTSYGPFAAIPKEFRPSLPAPPNAEYLNKARPQKPQNSPKQDSIWNGNKKDAISNTPSTKNQGSLKSEQISFTNNSCKNETPVPEKNINAADVNGKQISRSYQNKVSFLVRNPVPPKRDRNFQNYPKIPNNRQLVQKTTVKEHGTVFKDKLSSEIHKKGHNNLVPFQNPNTVSRSKESKFQSKKNTLKYEVMRKRDHETLQAAFQIPPDSFSKDRLQYDTKFVGERKEVARKENKNLCSKAKVDPHDDFQECLVKWDSSLELGNHSSDDTEGEIKWKLIQEQKTTVRATKTTGKKYLPKKGSNECPPDKYCSWIEEMRPARKHFRQKKSDNKPNESETTLNHYGRYRAQRRKAPKHDKQNREDYTAQTPIYKNDLRLNNNLACVQKEYQNSKPEKTCCNVSDKSFARQSGINIDFYQTAVDDFSTLERSCKLVEMVDKELKPANRNNIYPTLVYDSPIMYNLKKDNDKQLKLTANNFEDFNRNLKPDTCIAAKMDNVKQEDLDDRKNFVLGYGREMSDLIIGSHEALSLFFFFYKEWKRLRVKLIDHLEQLEKELKESTKKFTRYREIINLANRSASIAAVLPLPHVSIAAKVVSLITGLFSSIFTEKKTAEVEDANELTSAVLKDTNATSDLYMHGMQCHQQFEETVKQIEQFCGNVGHAEFFEDESPEIADFIKGVSEYKPNHRIFYKKLQKCFQELLQSATSDFGNRFCEPFRLYPSMAVHVIQFLDWRFNFIDFNPESVQYELEQIQSLIQCENPLIEDLLKRIQTCIRMLRDELEFIESSVLGVSMFESSLERTFAKK